MGKLSAERLAELRTSTAKPRAVGRGPEAASTSTSATDEGTNMADLSSASREAAVVSRLRDESEIRAVVARYARGMDRGDHDLVRSCYHADATDAHGDFNGDIESFLAYAAQFVDAMESMTHHT